MPTPSRLHLFPFHRVLAPVLALALAGCHYDYHCCCEDPAHGKMPQGSGQQLQPMAQPTTVAMTVPDSNGTQQPGQKDHAVAEAERERADRDAAEQSRREAAEREQQQRDEERATTERVHREMHDRLDRLGERLARLERILLLMSRRMQDADRGR
jgi:hypothetical protein